MDEEMYVELILEHYKNPQNFGKIEKPDIYARGDNPLCGDKIEMFLKIKNNVVTLVKFFGSGCAISQASASILTGMIKGKTVEELNKFNKEALLKELGIKLTPIRLKCALLSYNVLKKGLQEYTSKINALKIK